MLEESAKKGAQEDSKEITFSSHKFKTYLPWIILFALLILGGYLRFYHIDYPVVGYHNWKETHYLTEARNFAREGFFAHGFFVPAWDLPFVTEDLSGAHADTFPTISILGAISFKIFGEELWAARSIGVLLNLASIIFLYIIVKQLFKREALALVTAALAAINPLMVFFSRNFQLDSPALFLMLAGTYFFLKWIEHDKPRDFLLCAAFVTFGIITKYSFVVMALPFLVVFPYRRLLAYKTRLKTFVPGLLISLAFPLWFWYMEFYFKAKIKALYGATGGAVISLTDIVNFGTAFTAEYWMTMKSFFADNFTLLGMIIAVIGLVLLVIFRKKYALGAKFMLSYAGLGILFSIVLAAKLGGHSYHQFPYAPLIVFLIAFAFVVLATTLTGLTTIPHLRWPILIGLILLLWYGVPSLHGGVPDALERQFGTQFPGLDAAGDLVKLESQPWERIMHSSHQSYGILWNADRKGYKLPDTVWQIQDLEEANATWIFVYQWRFNIFQNPEVMTYLRQNYQLRQIGFTLQKENFSPYYYLFEKGGSFDETKLNELLSGKPVSSRRYEMPGGIFELNIITLARQIEP